MYSSPFPVISSLLNPNISLSTLFSRTLEKFRLPIKANPIQRDIIQFSVLQIPPDFSYRLWGPTCEAGCISKLQRPLNEGSHSSSSTAGLRSTWNYTSIPPYAFMTSVFTKHRDNYTFTFTFLRTLYVKRTPTVWCLIGDRCNLNRKARSSESSM